MHKEHIEFSIDKTKDLPLWRYMDFWKFLKMVSTSKLFFSNVQMLGDQHEGRIPEKIYNMMLEEDKRLGRTNNFSQNYKGFIENSLRRETLICSWIANKKESFAMWKMYAKEKLGIAIKTNYERLKNSFARTSEDIYIGEVHYYDDDKPYYRLGNTFYSFLVKHNYYEFESEVRCITELKQDAKDMFKNIDVDLNTLIEDVYISPFAIEAGFHEILEFLKTKYRLTFNIKTSGINDSWL